ncbi:MAG: helix-turn-helix transcriptional regulator [Thaumarchaeota archaeon]|nr:helix-turn-helix transcriptional regulator [Nitrososphaerota archaeon]MBI3642008.1 helix-turn-helix transcriptional regulator [Nitrososphaerota archaeon]
MLILQNSKYLRYKVRSNVVTSKNQSNVICLCPLDGVIDTIGKKWGLLIINEIGNHGKLRYNELLSELKGISPSTLASMLKEFEKERLVEKEIFREIPPRVEYSLSTRGKELREAIVPLLKWALKKGNYTVHCTCSLVRK